ncbi:MAG: ABC transporter ATP-binding protein [Spirochaetes bacterium]|nr:ABC transporter ATP-binding protein [Spirochaetota bacterium]
MNGGIVAESLSVGYGLRVVARELSFRAQAGRMLALVGPNGSGKTTLLRTIASLLPPLGGSVSVDGRDPFRMGARTRASLLSYVPQSAHASWPFTAGEVVSAGRFHATGWFGRATNGDRAAGEEAMATVGVEALADRRIDELSGGELRRVFIARAIAQRAPFMLLDEPAAHLDPARQIELMDVLARLASKGTAVILSIHDVNLARRYAGDALVLLPGGVAVFGPAGEVLSRDNLETAFGASFVLGHHDEYGHFALPVSDTREDERPR